MSRRNTRENAFKLTYERVMNGEKNPITFDLVFKSLDPIQQPYLTQVYNGVDEHYSFLSSLISRYSEDFALDRVYKVDLSILLLSIYEILFIDDIPDVTSVNEALEIAKAYSTENSNSYINGILASIIKCKEEILNEIPNS